MRTENGSLSFWPPIATASLVLLILLILAMGGLEVAASRVAARSVLPGDIETTVTVQQ